MKPTGFTQLALIGPTASGKTALALRLAEEFRAVILSIDSLALYKEIDIASAKPTPKERAIAPHFGIDLIFPDQHFNVSDFITLYRQAKEAALQHDSPLLLIGGSGFYLKTLMEGLSSGVVLNDEQRALCDVWMTDLSLAYSRLQEIDPVYAGALASQDRYRIQKALEIFIVTGRAPGEYFAKNPRDSGIGTIPIAEIQWPMQVLAERIAQRTESMFAQGLIDEVAVLERRYGREPKSMGAIGIKEVLAYLDGKKAYEATKQEVAQNTKALAKRQMTFNRSQFSGVYTGDVEEVYHYCRSVLL